jgi:hypothetical protein
MIRAKDLVKRYNLKVCNLRTVAPLISDIYAEFTAMFVGEQVTIHNLEEITDRNWNAITKMICEVKEIGRFKCLPLNIHEVLKAKVMLPIYSVKFANLSDEQEEYAKVMNKGRPPAKVYQKPRRPVEAINNPEQKGTYDPIKRVANIHTDEDFFSTVPGFGEDIKPAPIELPGGFGLLGLDEGILDLSNEDARQAVKDNFRTRIKVAHPDKGGSKRMSEMLYDAKKQCLDYLGEEEMPVSATE